MCVDTTCLESLYQGDQGGTVKVVDMVPGCRMTWSDTLDLLITYANRNANLRFRVTPYLMSYQSKRFEWVNAPDDPLIALSVVLFHVEMSPDQRKFVWDLFRSVSTSCESKGVSHRIYINWCCVHSVLQVDHAVDGGSSFVRTPTTLETPGGALITPPWNFSLVERSPKTHGEMEKMSYDENQGNRAYEILVLFLYQGWCEKPTFFMFAGYIQHQVDEEFVCGESLEQEDTRVLVDVFPYTEGNSFRAHLTLPDRICDDGSHSGDGSRFSSDMDDR